MTVKFATGGIIDVFESRKQHVTYWALKVESWEVSAKGGEVKNKNKIINSWSGSGNCVGSKRINKEPNLRRPRSGSH